MSGLLQLEHPCFQLKVCRNPRQHALLMTATLPPISPLPLITVMDASCSSSLPLVHTPCNSSLRRFMKVTLTGHLNLHRLSDLRTHTDFTMQIAGSKKSLVFRGLTTPSRRWAGGLLQEIGQDEDKKEQGRFAWLGVCFASLSCISRLISRLSG